MPLGDRRYFMAIPPAERELDDALGLDEPNWYIRSHDAPPVYPSELRDLLLRHREERAAGPTGRNGHTNGNGDGVDAEPADATPAQE